MTLNTLLTLLAVYFILHSILADADLMGRIYHKWWYRFFYVVQSVVLFIPISYIYLNLPSEPFFTPSLPVKNVLYIIWVSGIVLALFAVRSYENSSFLGIKQVKMKLKGQEYKYKKPTLIKTGALSVVRHPYYTAALILIWAKPLTDVDFYTNILLTIYFILGTINEERKLKKEFGQEYLDYMKEVPALIPFIKLRKKDAQ